ncbi:MAG: carbon-nitrogen hydrolase family protein [Pseudomonadota bacterium]
MRVAVIQMRSTTSIADNCATMDELVRKAADQGATYIQTPEMTGILQKNRKGLFVEITSQQDDVLVGHAADLAEELGIWLHIGSHAVLVDDQKAANRAFLFSPAGELVTTYDKIHMFDVDLDNGESWRESKVYRPGDRTIVADTDSARIGLSICYDVRFPHLYREQALAGAQILSAPAAFTRQTGRAHWHVLMRARAIENGAFMIAAAQGGDHKDGRETFGHSLVVNPWGEIIAEIKSEEPGFALADIDMGEVTKARSKIPNLANGREFVIEHISGKAEAVA